MLRKEVAARNNLWISGRDSEPFLENEKIKAIYSMLYVYFHPTSRREEGGLLTFKMLKIKSYHVLKEIVL